MNISYSNQTSFKNIYSLKGEPGLLDDICSYYGRVQSRTRGTNGEFNFLSVRSPFSLRSPKPTGLNTTNGKCCFDLFITSQEERIAEPMMRDAVMDMIQIERHEKPAIQLFKTLLDRLSELDERIRAGKPILGIDPNILKTHLESLIDFPSLREIEAEDAYSMLKKDSFDLTAGTMGHSYN